MSTKSLSKRSENQNGNIRATNSKISSNSTHLSAGCPHIQSHIKGLVDKLKVLAPYSIICSKRQTLLLGRRGTVSSSSFSQGSSSLPNGSNQGNLTDYSIDQNILDSTNNNSLLNNSANLEGDRSRKRLVEEMPTPLCDDCQTPLDRIHACLECDYYGCWKSKSKRYCSSRPSSNHYSSPLSNLATENLSRPHIIDHLDKCNHSFAVDFYRLQIYCHRCKDYIYDPSMLSWLRGMTVRWYAALCDAAEPEAKRPRIIGVSIDITPQEARFAKEHGTVRPCGGLRGLRNLGNSCFLNVVVQVLFQNPMIRGWMLSGGHSPTRCVVGRRNLPASTSKIIAPKIKGATNQDSKSNSVSDLSLKSQKDLLNPDSSQKTSSRASSVDNVNDPNIAKSCIGCELYSLLLNFFSGETSPIGASRLLHSLWVLRPDLAGYGQQDAHECFIAILDLLHNCLEENVIDPEQIKSLEDSNDNSNSILNSLAKKSSSLNHNDTCSCVVHQTFGGILQSTVVCNDCGNVSVAYDPVLDLSLDIEPVHIKSQSKLPSSSSTVVDKAEDLSSASINSQVNAKDESSLNPFEINEQLENQAAFLKKTSTADFELRKKYKAKALKGDFTDLSDTNGSSSSIPGEVEDDSLTKNNGNYSKPPFNNLNFNSNAHVQTLQKCLEQFTNPEILGNGMYSCSNCESSNAFATKQFSIKQLPPVLSFQLKRFNRGISSTSKLNTYVRLPLNLDMTPYTTNTIVNNSLSDNSFNSQSTFSAGTPLSTYASFAQNGPSGSFSEDLPLSSTSLNKENNASNSGINSSSFNNSRRRPETARVNPACQYQLFAVINHSGALDTGHYTLYSQHRNQWFKFDDSTITFADISDVLCLEEEARCYRGEASKGLAYMAFYVKQTLDFNDPPSLDGDAINAPGSVPGLLSIPTSLSGASGFINSALNPNNPAKKVERRGRKRTIDIANKSGQLTTNTNDSEPLSFKLKTESGLSQSSSSDSDSDSLPLELAAMSRANKQIDQNDDLLINKLIQRNSTLSNSPSKNSKQNVALANKLPKGSLKIKLSSTAVKKESGDNTELNSFEYKALTNNDTPKNANSKPFSIKIKTSSKNLNKDKWSNLLQNKKNEISDSDSNSLSKISKQSTNKKGSSFNALSKNDIRSYFSSIKNSNNKDLEIIRKSGGISKVYKQNASNLKELKNENKSSNFTSQKLEDIDSHESSDDKSSDEQSGDNGDESQDDVSGSDDDNQTQDTVNTSLYKNLKKNKSKIAEFGDREEGEEYTDEDDDDDEYGDADGAEDDDNINITNADGYNDEPIEGGSANENEIDTFEEIDGDDIKKELHTSTDSKKLDKKNINSAHETLNFSKNSSDDDYFDDDDEDEDDAGQDDDEDGDDEDNDDQNAEDGEEGEENVGGYDS
ncbi:Ubiquitin carboxyl-terminal hydrolase nonstop [Smittium culicis]|uniref:Ubiquitin carboxyl-terminal hydrolase nonstop n=1 Tax=Smittium culicis TaxID=133412 RepID=A0A1R1X232_9FUNG|nr:Ubiquitin carboxyl-terminal hydrolase nonstop [Smittium culicis]